MSESARRPARHLSPGGFQGCGGLGGPPRDECSGCPSPWSWRRDRVVTGRCHPKRAPSVDEPQWDRGCGDRSQTRAAGRGSRRRRLARDPPRGHTRGTMKACEPHRGCACCRRTSSGNCRRPGVDDSQRHRIDDLSRAGRVRLDANLTGRPVRMTQERGRRQQAVPADAIPSCPSEMPEPMSSRRDAAVHQVNRHRAGYVARRALPPCAVADLQRAQRLDDERAGDGVARA
jgi:hypothetical protein